MKYYLYLSPTKVEMLFDQLPATARGLAETLAGEAKLRLGILDLTLRKDKPNKNAASLPLIEKCSAVCEYLRKNGRIGTIERPQAYFAASMSMRWGSIREYAADIAFFGGESASTSVALVGSRKSLSGGDGSLTDSGHSPDYYLFRFLSSIDDAADRAAWSLKPSSDVGTLATLPYYRGIKSFNHFMSRVPNPPQTLEFVARTLLSHSDAEHTVLLASPLYVALEDAEGEQTR